MEVEEMKQRLEVEDREKMRKFQIKECKMQVEKEMQKDVEITPPRKGKCKYF